VLLCAVEKKTNKMQSIGARVREEDAKRLKGCKYDDKRWNFCVFRNKRRARHIPLNSLLVFSVFLTMFVFDAIHLVHISVTKLYLSVTSGADRAFDHTHQSIGG
jgi:hypothetical protein